MADQRLLIEIGRRIKLRRKQMEYTQEQLAELMDVSVQMISNLEQGKKAIRPENLVKLCYFLAIDADYILTGKRAHAVHDDVWEKYAALPQHNKELVEQLLDSWLE